MARLKEKREEMTFTAYVRIEGRMTIPLEIRDVLDIERANWLSV